MTHSKDNYSPNFRRRHKNHDYRAPWIYHITISKYRTCPDFGRLSFDAANPRAATIVRSPIGNLLAQEIVDLRKYHPAIQIYQFVIMPDHAHILLRVKEHMEKPLGYVIGNLKSAVARKWRIICGDSTFQVFEDGFNDRIIYPHRSLEAVFRYVRENPGRLAVRKAMPDFFRRCNSLRIGGRELCTYGNLQLLENPFREQVVVHRRNSAEENERLRELWLHTAAGGGVLVSPFISAAEKAVRAEAEAAGGRFIVVVNKSFGERYKPALHDFGLCAQGRLLIVGLPGADGGDVLSREDCLAMNALAAELSACGATDPAGGRPHARAASRDDAACSGR